MWAYYIFRPHHHQCPESSHIRPACHSRREHVAQTNISNILIQQMGNIFLRICTQDLTNVESFLRSADNSFSWVYSWLLHFLWESQAMSMISDATFLDSDHVKLVYQGWDCIQVSGLNICWHFTSPVGPITGATPKVIISWELAMQNSHCNNGTLGLTYLTNLPRFYDLELFCEKKVQGHKVAVNWLNRSTPNSHSHC